MEGNENDVHDAIPEFSTHYVGDEIITGRIEEEKNIGSMAIRSDPYKNPSSLRKLEKAIKQVTKKFPNINFIVSRNYSLGNTSESGTIPLDMYWKEVFSINKNWYDKLSKYLYTAYHYELV